MSYGDIEDHILGVANQKVQFTKPVPMDVGSLETKPEKFREEMRMGEVRRKGVIGGMWTP